MLHSTQELAQLLPCFGFNRCGSFESKWAAPERQPPGQLQAANLFETEEVHGLKKMKKKKNQQ